MSVGRHRSGGNACATLETTTTVSANATNATPLWTAE